MTTKEQATANAKTTATADPFRDDNKKNKQQQRLQKMQATAKATTTATADPLRG
jgi:hypothetical protein